MNSPATTCSALAQRIGVRAAEAAQGVWVLFLVPILAIFFLRDGGTFHEVSARAWCSRARSVSFCRMCSGSEPDARPVHSRPVDPGGAVVPGIHLGPGGLRVPYALMLGTAGGAMEFVPVVGPLLAGAAMIVVAILAGYSHWASGAVVFDRSGAWCRTT